MRRALTIACVLRSGGVYTPEWVWALKRGLCRHLAGYRSPLAPPEPDTWTLRCLSDVDLGPTGVPLVHGWPGWWSKLELFRPGLFEGRVLYLDLDTLPVGDLSDLAAYDGPFAMLSDFYDPRRAESGVMAWAAGPETDRIYEAFAADPVRLMARHRADGRFIAAHSEPVRVQGRYPGQVVSYKVHARARAPEGARLVCAHGRPKFSDPSAGWAHEAWLDLTRAAA